MHHVFRNPSKDHSPQQSTWLPLLTALRNMLQPDLRMRTILVQEHLCRRPYHHTRNMRQSGPSNTRHSPFLGDIGGNADQHWQQRGLFCPLSRSEVVYIRGKLDRQIAHIHRAAIPLQPETYVLLSYAIVREPHRASDCTTVHPPGSVVRTPFLSPTSRVHIPPPFLRLALHFQRSHRFPWCDGYAVRAMPLLTEA